METDPFLQFAHSIEPGTRIWYRCQSRTVTARWIPTTDPTLVCLALDVNDNTARQLTTAIYKLNDLVTIEP
jgi:hypothetical protein